MFSDCYEFDQDLSKWGISRSSKVKDMSGMFRRCKKFDLAGLKWGVGKAKLK